MAIASDQLKITVDLETKGLDREYKSIADKLRDLEKLVKKADKSTQDYADNAKELEKIKRVVAEAGMSWEGFVSAVNQAEKSMDAVGKASSSVNKGLEDQAKSIEKVTSQYKTIDSAAKRMTGTNRGVASSLKQLSLAFTSNYAKILQFIDLINNVISVLRVLLDPDNIQKARRLVTVLAVLARLKGYHRVADGLGAIGAQLGSLQDKVEMFNGTSLKEMIAGFTTFGRNVIYTVNVIRSLIDIFESLTNPETLERLRKMLTLLSTILRIKGYKDLSEQVSGVAESVGEFATAMAEAKGSTEKLVKLLGIANSFYGVLDASVETAETGAIGLASAYGLLSLKQAANIRIARDGAMTYKDMFGNLTRDSSKAFNTFTKLGSASQKIFRGELSTTIFYAKAFTSNLVNVQKSAMVLSGSIKNDATKAFQAFNAVQKENYKTGKFLAKGLGQLRGNFMKIAAHSATGSRLLNIAEHTTGLATAFFALGKVLSTVDNRLANVASMLLILGGILVGGPYLLIKGVGGTMVEVADNMISRMEMWAEKASKAEVAQKFFNYTLRGFQQSFGQGIIGTLDEWNDTIQEISENSILGAGTLRKMAAEIIQIGAPMGLAVEQQKELLGILPDFITSENEAMQATIAFAKALQGQSQGVVGYGLHMDDASVSHSNFAKSLEGSMASMTAMDKAQVRYGALLEQHEPIRGRAAALQNTISGSVMRSKRAIEGLTTAIGEQGAITILYNNAITALVETFTRLPDGVIAVTGGLYDLLAVSLKVLGVLLKISVPIAVVYTSFQIWKTIIDGNVIALRIVSSTITYLAAALKVQTVAVTSSSSAWIAFTAILKGVAVQTFLTLGEVILITTRRIWAFTVALVSNPLFIKASIIVAAIILIVKGLQRLEEKTRLFSSLWGNFSRAISSIFGGASDKVQEDTSNLVQWVTRLGNGLIDLTTGAIAMVTTGLLGMYVALLKLIDLFPATEAFAAGLNGEIDDTVKTMEKLAVVALQSFENLGGTQKALADTEKAARKAARSFRELGNAVGMLDKQIEASSILGSRAEVLSIQTQLSAKRYADLEKEIKQLKSLGHATDELKRKEKELAKIRLEMDKNRFSMTKEVRDSIKASEQAMKEASDKFTGTLVDAKSIRGKMNMAISEIKKEIEKRRGELTVYRAFDVRQTRRALGLLQSEMSTRIKKVMEESKKEIQALAVEANKAFKNITIEIGTGGSPAEKEASAHQKRLQQIKEVRDLLKASDELSEEKIKKLEELQNKSDVMRLENLKKYRKNYDKLVDRVETFEMDEIDTIQRNLDIRLDKIDAVEAELKSAEQLGDKEKEILDLLRKQEEIRANKKIAEVEANIPLVDGVQVAQNLVDAYNDGIARIGASGTLLELDIKVSKESLANFEKAFSTVLEGFKGGMDGVTSLISAGLTAALGPIGTAIGELVKFFSMSPDQFKEVMDSFIQAIIDLPNFIAQNIPVFHKALMDALPEFLQSAIRMSISFMPQIAFSLVNAIFSALVDPEFWKSLGQAVVDGIAQGIGDILGIFDSNFRFDSFKEDAKKVVDDINKSVEGFSEQVFSIVDNQAFLRGKSRGAQIGIQIQGATINAASLLSQAWEGLKQAGSWVSDKIGQALEWIGREVFKPILEGIGAAFMGVMEAFAWIGENVFKPFGEVLAKGFGALKQLLDWAIGGIVDGSFFKYLEELFTDFLNIFKGGIIDDAFNGILSLGDTMGDWGRSLWDGFTEHIGAAGQGFADFGAIMWDGFYNFLKTAPKAFEDFGVSIWEGLKGVFGKGLDFSSKIAAQVGKGITDVVNDPLGALSDLSVGIDKAVRGAFSGIGTIITNAFTGTADTIKGVFKDVKDSVGNIMKGIFAIDMKGTGPVEKFIGLDFPWVNFAGGGMVPGKASVFGDSLKNDVVPSLLSPGEIVLPRSVTMDKGMMANLAAALGPQNAKALGVPTMASGGVLGSIQQGGRWFDKEVVQPVLSTGGDILGKIGAGAEEIGGAVVDALAPGTVEFLQSAKKVYDFLLSLGANVDYGALLRDPVNTARNAFKGLSKDYFQPFVKKAIGLNSGGMVPGYGNTDTMPIMATPGEYVINRDAAKKLGRPLLDGLNSGKTGGGTVNNEYNIKLDIKTEQPVDEKFVRSVLMPTIQRELRKGSLAGRRTLAPQGVR